MKPLSEIVRAREKGIPFESVKTELEEALPCFPDDILYQWVYWHNSQFVDDNAFIGLSRFHFEYKRVNCEWVYSVSDENIEVLDYWGEDFLKGNRNRTWLGEYVHENKTWPNPIIVLDVKSSMLEDHIIESKHIRGDYFLLEGHLRLAYVRALIRESIANISHDVWIASIY